MKARLYIRWMLPVFVLFAISRSGLALPLQTQDLIYENNTGSISPANTRWFLSEIDTSGDTGLHTAVVFEPYDDIPYVTYYNETTNDLMLAWYLWYGSGNCTPNNDWVCSKLDSDDDVGQYSSIASDPTKVLYMGIAYYDATYRALKYIEYSRLSMPWKIYTIDMGPPNKSSAGLYTSIKYDGNGTQHISYYTYNTSDVDALMIAYFVGSGGNCGYGTQAGRWQCDEVHTGEGVGQYTALDVDGTGNAHIAYYDAVNGDLWYATNSTGTNCGPGGNTWTCIPVSSANDVGKYASMYVDSVHNFHIAYYDETNGKLMYAYKVSGGGNCGVFGSAQCDEIGAMPSQYFTHSKGISIAEDAAGYPIIAYQSEYGDLNVARPLTALGMPGSSGNCGPQDLFYTWYCETVHRYNWFVNARHGDFAAIGFNSAGLATIAYYEFITSSGGNLGVAQQRFEVFQPLVSKSH